MTVFMNILVQKSQSRLQSSIIFETSCIVCKCMNNEYNEPQVPNKCVLPVKVVDLT